MSALHDAQRRLRPAVLARGWTLGTLTCSRVRHAMVEVDGDAVVMGSASGRPDGAGWSRALPRLIGVRALLVTSAGRHLTTASWTGQGRVHNAT